MIILSVAAGVLFTGIALYFYWLYAPIPPEPALASKISRERITVGGHERTYWRYVPPRSSHEDKMPLLIVLHGSGIDGARMRAWTGFEFDILADRYGFAVAYPDGYEKNWNDIRKSAPFKAKEKNIDDIGFIKALIERYQSVDNINIKRVHVFGYSNGGNMAFRLALQEPGLLAAIATVAASLPTQDNRLAEPNGFPLPIMMVNGTKDPIIPYDGGKVNFFGKKMGNVVSALSTIKTFIRARPNVSEETEPLPHLNTGGGTSVERLVWHEGGRVLAVLYTVHGGGHVIPQPVARFPRLMGKVAGELDAPGEAVAFFGLNK
ncbi:alpha/beta hydrolase family esterase [Mucilaginibacter litoreus]|uniref:Alpha/beta hydrolase family esterase n=1 Tax=Mucilaginibacter litoreus TaxID=1048221 RepID=A0ABW3AUN4_9SPHI